jgi:hypothetical protein
MIVKILGDYIVLFTSERFNFKILKLFTHGFDTVLITGKGHVVA